MNALIARESAPSVERRSETVGWIWLGTVVSILWAPNAVVLWHAWHIDPALTFGPLMPLLFASLLWMRRSDLRAWRESTPPALGLIAAAGVIYAGASLVDIVFVRLCALIAVTLGVVWYLGGRAAQRAVWPPAGMLLFMVPWPTTLTERLAFPMQMASTAYAAQLSGMLGLPVVRNGVELSIVPQPGGPPLYSIVVAGACSGMTSLTVLLSLGYLVVLLTPTSFFRRAGLLASVMPLALFANALRLTVILIIGAHHAPGVAEWVHDHEQPLLMFLCMAALLGIRSLLMGEGLNRPSDSGEAESA